MNTKDPLVEATVSVLNEGTDLSRWIKETVDESKDYHPMDALQVATSLIYNVAKRLKNEDSKISDKLILVFQQLDRIADSY